MSTQDGQQNPGTTTTVEQPAQQPQQQQQQQPPQGMSPQQWAQTMVDAMNALPERIVASLRESAPQPPKTTQNKPTENKPAENKPTEPGQPPDGMSALAKWWFS